MIWKRSASSQFNNPLSPWAHPSIWNAKTQRVVVVTAVSPKTEPLKYLMDAKMLEARSRTLRSSRTQQTWNCYKCHKPTKLGTIQPWDNNYQVICPLVPPCRLINWHTRKNGGEDGENFPFPTSSLSWVPTNLAFLKISTQEPEPLPNLLP